MGGDVGEEFAVEAGGQSDVVGVPHGEPAEAHPEQVQRAHGQPEVGERADEDQQGREGGVEDAAAPPGGDDAEQVAEHGRDDERDAAEQQGPADLRADHVGDRGGEAGDGDAEVAGEDALDVGDVLLPEGAVVEAEEFPQLGYLVGLHRALGLREHPGDRVARHEARENEVQCDGGPEGEQIEPQVAQDQTHGSCSLSVGGELWLGAWGRPSGEGGRRSAGGVSP